MSAEGEDKANEARKGHKGAPQTMGLSDIQLSFIQDTISSTLRPQSARIKAVVLFIFVFLFVYIVIVALQGSIVLTVKLLIPNGAQTSTSSTVQLPAGERSGYVLPDPGYELTYDNIHYGLNSYGEARVDLTPRQYAFAVASRSISVSVRPPGKAEYYLDAHLSGLSMEPITLGKTAATQLGSLTIPWKLGGDLARSSANGSFLVGEVFADTLPGWRLYIQSVTVSSKFEAGEVSGTLTIGASRYPLFNLSSDLGTAAESSLLVKGNVPLIQDYRSFFGTSNNPSGGTIELKAPSGLFVKGESETYLLSVLPVGIPVSVPGNSGGKLVVQLMRPFDVILFERRNSFASQDALMAQISQKGYVPRLNLNSATLPGDYNVIYSGEDVPTSVLKDVVTIATASGIHLRSIQPHRHLTNGIQNQIQIGSTKSVSCLPIIDNVTQAALAQSSDAQFGAIVSNLAAGACTD